MSLTTYDIANLQLKSNSITSTNINGNISLLPNGSGEVLLKANPVSSLGAATKQYVDTFTPTSTNTLTNKTIDALNNTLLNISNSNISHTANIDATKLSTGIISNTEFNYLDGVTSNIQTQINSIISGSSSIANTEVSATQSTSTNSSNYQLLDSMTVTPVSGTYLVLFSAGCKISKFSSSAYFGISKAATATVIPHSEREMFNITSSNTDVEDSNVYDVIHTHAKVVLDGAETVKVYYKTTNSATCTVYSRCLELIKLS